MNQFKYSEDNLYKKSNVRLVYVGHKMYAELKHIQQPKPKPAPIATPSVDHTRRKPSSGKQGRKVTDRGDKPRSKHGRKQTTSMLPQITDVENCEIYRHNIHSSHGHFYSCYSGKFRTPPPVALPNVNDTNTSTSVPVGHDTATTDEEEAAEALLALCYLPDMGDEDDAPDDNATLLPIGGPSLSIDVNPVQVKLSSDDISQVIEQLTDKSRYKPPTNTLQPGAKEQPNDNNKSKPMDNGTQTSTRQE